MSPYDADREEVRSFLVWCETIFIRICVCDDFHTSVVCDEIHTHVVRDIFHEHMCV